jgi:predicted amidohydrolase YtcJ
MTKNSTCLLVLAFCVAGAALPQPPIPDLVISNVQVITMNPNQPAAEAIAVQGERIVWVGPTNEAKTLTRPTTRALDLHGATVLPGMIDAHGHMLSLGQSLLKLNLKDAPTQQEVLARVKQKIAGTPQNEWIQGWGWDEGKWASHYPNNEALSSISPNNPVYLVGLHGFAAWANKRALQLAGITKLTKDPENGKILRDETSGEPTGILLNRAQELVARIIPPMTLDQAKSAMLAAAHECVRNGLTEVHDAQVTPLMLAAFQELVREKRMPLRLYLMLDGADKALVAEWLTRGPLIDAHHQLTIRAFKLFADGALGSRGAALLAPYSDAPQTQGVVTTSEADVYDFTRRSLQRGFQVCTHAIGDAANRSVLNAYGRALQEAHDSRDARMRIEHAQVLAPDDIPRFAKLGVIASMQPVHCTSDMSWAETRLGPERAKGAYAWRSVMATGAHVPFSSDFPGETLNPFYGIYAAITRQDPSGNPPEGWHPEQKVTLQQALRGYTFEAAYASFEEDVKGSIAPGKLADFTIISANIGAIPAKDILSTKVLQTYIAGKSVYEANSAAGAPQNKY